MFFDKLLSICTGNAARIAGTGALRVGGCLRAEVPAADGTQDARVGHDDAGALGGNCARNHHGGINLRVTDDIYLRKRDGL